MEIYRHGDLILERIDSIPEGLTQKDNNILLEGEATGHCHTITKAKIFLPSEPPALSNDLLLAYLQTEEGALLTHQEHKTIEIPAGLYRATAQREFDPQEEYQVKD
jgi:hypothetical protein